MKRLKSVGPFSVRRGHGRPGHRNPLQRFIKLDVWAIDTDKAVYDAEVQERNTHNLPRRSRLYQGMIDSDLLPPGVVDFNKLNDAYMILISPKKAYEKTFVFSYAFCFISESAHTDNPD